MNVDYEKLISEHNSLMETSVKSLVSTCDKRERFMKGLQIALNGYEIACRIISQDPNIHYLIMRKHIGDVMRMLKQVILFKEYYSENEPYHCPEECGKALPKEYCVKKIVIITTELLAGLTHLFSSVDDVVILSNREMECLSVYSKSYICIHLNLHRDEYGLFGDLVGEQAKSTMFGIHSYNWVLNLPMKIPDKAEKSISSIKIHPSSFEAAKDILHSHRAVADKTVIICPYAQSSSMLSESDWSPFIARLKNKMYTVFTNVGIKEKELPQTIRLQCPIDVYAALGALGCAIVGVQSGIIDVIRWMENDTRLIDIGVLLKPIDIKFAKNRHVLDSIDRKKNTTHLLLEKTEIKEAVDKIEEQFYYYEKGSFQRNLFNQRKRDGLLYSLANINDYVQYLTNIEHVVIFLSVCGTVQRFWPLFNRQVLGICSDLSKKGNVSYVAVINKDEQFVWEKMGSDFREVKYQSHFNDFNKLTTIEEIWMKDNQYYVTSHAMGPWAYTKAAIVINGQQYAFNRNGLNIVVYDKINAYVMDSIWVDLDQDENLSVRRDIF